MGSARQATSLVILACIFCGQPQGQVLRKSALSRLGLHHSNVSGRFVDPKGQPVSGIHVQITQPQDPNSDCPMARTSSGGDGRFTFSNVSTSAPAVLKWFPPDQWVAREMPLWGGSLENIDLGSIELIPNTVLRVKLELAGPPPGKYGQPVIFLEGKRERVYSEKRGDYWILQQIPFKEGRWLVNLNTKKRVEHFSGHYVVELGRRDRLVTLRLLRNNFKTIDDVLWGDVQVEERTITPAPSPATCRSAGTVQSHGTPVHGAVVFGISDDQEPSWLLTDTAGQFRFESRGDRCYASFAAIGSYNSFGGSRMSPQRTPATRRQTIQFTYPWRLNINTSGVDPTSVRAYWLRQSIGWIPVPGTPTWIAGQTWGGGPIFKVQAPGYLPIVREIELRERTKTESHNIPIDIEEQFAFENQAVRELEVTANGKALADTFVDVVWIRDLSSNDEVMLESYRTGPDGKLRLLGAASQLTEVFVYANGYRPTKAVWTPDLPLHLSLAPLDARLKFPGLGASRFARVFQASQPEAVRTVRGRADLAAEVSLPAGQYDVVTYRADGMVLSPVAYQRIELLAGRTLSVDSVVDQRPTLVVHFPEPDWSAMVTDTPGGLPLNWTFNSFPDEPVTEERKSSEEAVYRVAKAGQIYIEVRNDKLDYTLWREIDCGPADTIRVYVPKVDATLRGSTRTYDGGLTQSDHGWAAPRMQLMARDPSAWSITVYLPKRDAERNFTLRELPAGSYTLYHHLIGGVKTTSLVDGTRYQYTYPVYAWGGIPVELRPGESTQLSDFSEYPFQNVPVTVQDAARRPVKVGTLRIRDRMSEHWHEMLDFIGNSAHPIPYPPAVRLQDGHATLPSIRAGRLELYVELDDGRIYPFTVTTDPPQALELTLPRD
jgi:hypothetical protein